MIRLFLVTLFILGLFSSGHAAVELKLAGEENPHLISSVYLRNGTLFLPLREILLSLHLRGEWDGAKHLYRISAPGGEILLAPGSRRVRYGKKTLPLKFSPLFLDGELCVPEEMLTDHLPRLLDMKLSYRNLDSFEGMVAEGADDNVLESSPLLQQVVIDPGHGGNDPGAISPDGVKEKDLVLALALRLEKVLKMEGVAPLLLTRDGDYAVPLQKRQGQLRGEIDANILLSLHASAWRNSVTHGCTLYTFSAGGDDERGMRSRRHLVQSLVDSLKDHGVADCSIEQAALLPLTNTPFPAILLELGYLTNSEDLALLSSDAGQDRIVRALAHGIKTYAATRPRRTNDDPVTQ